MGKVTDFFILRPHAHGSEAGAGEDDLETMLELSHARAEKETVPPQYQREEFELPLNTINSVNEEEKENIASSKPR